MHRAAARLGSSLVRSSIVVIALLHLSCGEQPDAVVSPGVVSPGLAGALVAETGTYVVTLRAEVRDVPGEAQRLANAHGGALGYTYERALHGFSITLPAQAAEALARAPGVQAIRPVVPLQLADVQTSPTWGLDRIDQSDLPLDGRYNYEGTGFGYTAYIIDTGIRTTHVEFGGRATTGWSVPDGLGGIDCHGHGTHVAGTVGGARYGVAKGVQLVAIRVFGTFGCSGNDADFLAAVDWLIANRRLPAVANMSISFGAIVPEADSAVIRLIASGVTVVAAAGNS